MATIYAIGDSHSIIYSKSKYIKEHWLGYGGNATNFPFPITMHKLSNEGLEIDLMPSRIGNGHEKHVPVKGDIVIFCYGYNDANKNISIQKTKNREEYEIIDVLIKTYIQSLKKIKENYGIIAMAYPTPPPSNLQKPNHIGEPRERLRWTSIMNEKMKHYCGENNILYINDFFNDFMDSEGFMLSEYCKDGIHIRLDKVLILENKILNYLKEQRLITNDKFKL
jgi:lysophospholipase L1-like esterase